MVAGKLCYGLCGLGGFVIPWASLVFSHRPEARVGANPDCLRIGRLLLVTDTSVQESHFSLLSDHYR